MKIPPLPYIALPAPVRRAISPSLAAAVSVAEPSGAALSGAALSGVGESVSPSTTPANVVAPSERSSAVDPKLVAAAHEFEAIFVRQLLKSSKVGGGDGEGGYSAMVVDSLAKSVTSGGAWGLAQHILDALSTEAAVKKELK